MSLSSIEQVREEILTVRSQKVILDNDLAGIYGVTIGRLNEQIKRNKSRFPADFCFQLTRKEWESIHSLRSQTAILEKGRGKHRGHSRRKRTR